MNPVNLTTPHNIQIDVNEKGVITLRHVCSDKVLTVELPNTYGDFVVSGNFIPTDKPVS